VVLVGFAYCFFLPQAYNSNRPSDKRSSYNLIGDKVMTLLEQVKQYALDNYGNGWDVIVEAYTDAELLEAIGKRKTLKSVVKFFTSKKEMGPVAAWQHQLMETRFGDEW
jgi:hypothetical protein